jgi:hypothetical protein
VSPLTGASLKRLAAPRSAESVAPRGGFSGLNTMNVVLRNGGRLLRFQ